MSGWAALERRFTRLTASQLFGLVFLIAFAVRVAAVFATHQYADLERFELERVALSLAELGVFGNPYAIPKGPTAHVSPGYPLILAAIFRLYGTGTGAGIVKQVFACACSASVCAFIPSVARALQLPAMAGIGAALFTALLPIKLKTETQGDWESPFAALGLILVLTLTVSAWRRGNFTTRSAIRSGIAWEWRSFCFGIPALVRRISTAGFFLGRSTGTQTVPALRRNPMPVRCRVPRSLGLAQLECTGLAGNRPGQQRNRAARF